MRMGTKTAAVCAVVCLYGNAPFAQSRTLTLPEVLARAREQAPEVVSARLAQDEARARLAGASVRFQSNPQIDLAVGPRRGANGRSTDLELGIDQSFEPSSRRSARVASAHAAIAQGAAHLDEVMRGVLRAAASAYFRAVHAADRIALLNRAFELSSAVHAAAERRFKAGDIAVLDVNLAKASLARVRADREGAEAARALALGELRQLLRLDADVSVAGTLSSPPPADLVTALQSSADRPELRLLDAGIHAAEAELRLGLSYARPEFGVGVRYSREEHDNIVLGGVTLTLPMFAKGQEQRAAGAGRVARLRAERDAARARIELEVRAAFEACTRRLAAVRVLEADAIAGLDENERLMTRSFELGQLGLPDLLLIRRETLDTRFQYLDALLEAALARTDLDASAALLR